MEQPPPPQPQLKSEYEKFVQQIGVFMLREPPELQQKLTQLRELYQPANVQEDYYLELLAGCQLTMQRLKRLEAGLFTLFIDHSLTLTYENIESVPNPLQANSDIAEEQRRNLVVADGFKNFAAKGDVLPFFFRFLTLGERNLRRAQEQFDRVRKQHLTPTAPKPLEVPPTDGQSKPEAKKQPKLRLLTSNGKSGPKPRCSRLRRPGALEKISLRPAPNRASRVIWASHRAQAHRNHAPAAASIANIRTHVSENRGQAP